MKRTKFFLSLRFISTLLALTLLTSSLPLFASTISESSSESVPSEYSADGVVIASEDVSKRDEFEKHYLLSDGAFLAVTYPEAVHYRDDEGNWEEVDNRLSFDPISSRYKTANPNFNATFAAAATAEGTVSLSSEGYTLSWSVSAEGVDKSGEKALLFSSNLPFSKIEQREKAQILSPAGSSSFQIGKPITEPSSFELPKISSQIGYPILFSDAPEISANYTVYQNKIEEDLYISSPTEVRSFRMNLKAAGLVAQGNDNGSVDFLDDEGKLVFRIGVPYMADAAGEVLNPIAVTVTQEGENCLIVYTPDEKWLTSEDRVYPILFDPSITTREYHSTIEDTYVVQDDTADHSSEKNLYYGIRSGKIRRTYIKINQLPHIDASMPVLSATMTLSFLSGTTTGKTMEVYRASSYWEPSAITFENQPPLYSSNLLRTIPYDSSSMKVEVNLSSDLATLYPDYLAAANYGYVIKYADESTTKPDYNVFYSTEYSTKGSRPILSVVYGYSLPSELKNGAVYAIQNAASASFLTVHNGTDANDTNVYQVSTPLGSLTSKNKFKLERVSSTGGYLFRAMCSSNGTKRVLDIVKSDGFVKDGGNVQIYSNNDSIAQEWLIIGTGNDAFRIVPRTNMSLALTVYPSSANGTASGTSSSSPGNVFVSTWSDSNYQKWHIYDEEGNILFPGGASLVADGIYYLNNAFSGQYLHNGGYTPNTANGLIANLGDSIRWKITNTGDGTVTIQPADKPGLYLTHEADGDIYISAPIGSTLSSSQLWRINGSSVGGALIQSVAWNQYLKQGKCSSIDKQSSTGIADKECSWRIVSDDSYHELQRFTVQRPQNFEIGQTDSFVINPFPSNSTWVRYSDFNYTITSDSTGYNGNIKTNNETGQITGAAIGTLKMTVTHRVTGVSYSFSMEVKPKLKFAADYSLPTDIKNKLYTIRAYISQVSNNSSLSPDIDLIQELEEQENIIRADYIMTGNNYTSDYANAVIPNFLQVLNNNIDTVEEDLYRVVANRMLALYAMQNEKGEYDLDAYYLDEDCDYSEWTSESQAALNWYNFVNDNEDFFDSPKSGIGSSYRVAGTILNLHIFRYYHDSVKEHFARSVGGYTEISIPKANIKNSSDQDDPPKKYVGRADIVKSYGMSGSYIWEVKPNKPIYYGGGIGTLQLQKYLANANGVESGTVSKNVYSPTSGYQKVIFYRDFTAGVSPDPYYLTLPDFFSSDKEITLKVSPSPEIAQVPMDSGLVLYERVDGPTEKIPIYSQEEICVEVMNKAKSYNCVPIVTTINSREVLAIFAQYAVEGVMIGVCLICATELIPYVTTIIEGLASVGASAPVLEAIAAGTIVAVPLGSYISHVVDSLAA